jgi:hypothetical protein
MLDSQDRAKMVYESPEGRLVLASEGTSSWSVQSITALGTANCGRYSCAMDASGRIHVATTTNSDQVVYGLYDGQSWTTQTVGTCRQSSHNCLRLDGDGSPAIGYGSSTTSVAYAKQSGGSWTSETAGSVYGGNEAMAMAIDGDGDPWIVASDWRGLYSFHRSGSAWTKSLVLPYTSSIVDSAVLAFTPSGTPIMVFESLDYKLKFARWSTAGWSIEDLGQTCLGYMGMVCDDYGRVHVSYRGANGVLTYAWADVPEPSCLAAVLLGLTGLACIRRRR